MLDQRYLAAGYPIGGKNLIALLEGGTHPNIYQHHDITSNRRGPSLYRRASRTCTEHRSPGLRFQDEQLIETGKRRVAERAMKRAYFATDRASSAWAKNKDCLGRKEKKRGLREFPWGAGGKTRQFRRPLFGRGEMHPSWVDQGGVLSPLQCVQKRSKNITQCQKLHGLGGKRGLIEGTRLRCEGAFIHAYSQRGGGGVKKKGSYIYVR